MPGEPLLATTTLRRNPLTVNNFLADKVFAALRNLKVGTLTVELPDGRSEKFKGSVPDPVASIRIKDWRVFGMLLSRGDLGLLESYRDEYWDTPDLTALLCVGMYNMSALQKVLSGSLLSRIAARLRYLLQSNTLRGSRKNIHAHYDIGNEFYKLWLDPSMTYSSALFSSEHTSLEEAQAAKYQRIVDCLECDSGNLLEVGCGWGGFAEHALNQGDFGVRGLTLSDEQLAYAKQRLGPQADFALQDYRHEKGVYDRIVSIEMFEAVGERYWSTYFNKIGSLLKKGGKAVIQTITISDENFERYRRSADVIRTYIFPGGMLPSPERFQAVAEQNGLRVGEKFHFGRDYGKTLEHWLESFERKLPEVRAQGFDEAFVRIWRFYLASCIATFRSDATSVMQVELSHA